MTETYRPAEVFPAWEYLRDELEAREWTVAEFAEILGRPVQAVSEILNGHKLITAETANEIGAAFGTGPQVWLNLQSDYLVRKAEDADRLSDVERRARLRDLVPLAEIRRRGWIDASDLDGQEQQVCGLLGMSGIDATPRLALAARRANGDDPLTPAQRAWAGRVMQLAERVEVGTLDVAAVEAFGAGLARHLRDPTSSRGLPHALAPLGVALVVVPALKGSKIDGAVMPLPGGAMAVGLSLRGQRFDSAVFTLAHELAHIALGHVDAERVLVDEAISEGTSDDIEIAADEHAARWLFPQEPVLAAPVSTTAVLHEAERRGCHPALIVGRLHWRGDLPYTHLNRLIPRMKDVVGDLARS